MSENVYFFLNCGDSFRLPRGAEEEALSHIETALKSCGYSDLILIPDGLYQRLLIEPAVRAELHRTFVPLFKNRDERDPERMPGFGYIKYHLLADYVEDYATSFTENRDLDDYIADNKTHLRSSVVEDEIALQHSQPVKIPPNPASNRDSILHTFRTKGGSFLNMVDTYQDYGERVHHLHPCDENGSPMPELYLTYQENVLYWEKDISGFYAEYEVVRPLTQDEINAALFITLCLGELECDYESRAFRVHDIY